MSDLVRKQFENWFRDKIIEAPDFVFNKFSNEDNNYIVGDDDNIELYLHIGGHWMAWDEAWKASRAIEIELPEKIMVEDEFDNGHNCAIDYCKEAIIETGYRVKDK